MIRGVIFDLDHTLFDRYATIKKVMPDFYHHYREKIPKKLSVEEFIDRFISIEKKHIHYGWAKIIKTCVEEGILSPVADEEITEVVGYIINHCWSIAAVKYPFTNPMLIKLRQQGYKLGIVTNGGHACQDSKLKMLELYDLVDEVVISEDVGAHKPDPQPFLIMSEKIGIPPHELIYVGDHPVNDVDGSRRAGYIPVWVKTTGYWCFDRVPHADYEIETVEEIPDLLNKINNK